MMEISNQPDYHLPPRAACKVAEKGVRLGLAARFEDRWNQAE
jgi:hypothetical protein